MDAPAPPSTYLVCYHARSGFGPPSLAVFSRVVAGKSVPGYPTRREALAACASANARAPLMRRTFRVYTRAEARAEIERLRPYRQAYFAGLLAAREAAGIEDETTAEWREAARNNADPASTDRQIARLVDR